MSKTDKSPRLVGILRFDLPFKSTRTLSATQAHDTSRSHIVLGSFTGKLTDKTATEKGGGGITCNIGWNTTRFATVAGTKRDEGSPRTGTVTLSVRPIALDGLEGVAPKEVFIIPPEVTYSGMRPPDPGSSFMSKATNSNTIYYGAITVGLGKYKKWQGNYAVLKINTVTEKAVLRIYAD